MPDFPVRFDPETNTIQLDGRSGVRVLLSVLLKAKFGDALDPEVLLHAPLAAIMAEMRGRAEYPTEGEAEGPFSPEVLHIIATRVLEESWRSAWWSMSKDQQVSYLRDVVAAPHPLSDAQIDSIFDSIKTGLYWRRRLIEAADKAGVR
jgi:hypothetical protein